MQRIRNPIVADFRPLICYYEWRISPRGVILAILMGRFARAGAVAFVVTWAAATLTVTAASLDAGSRPSVQAGTPDVGRADTVPDADADADADISSTPTIRLPTTTAARAPATGAATSTTITRLMKL